MNKQLLHYHHHVNRDAEGEVSGGSAPPLQGEAAHQENHDET